MSSALVSALKGTGLVAQLAREFDNFKASQPETRDAINKELIYYFGVPVTSEERQRFKNVWADLEDLLGAKNLRSLGTKCALVSFLR